jgi:iron complex transport system ATP-binding protein
MEPFEEEILSFSSLEIGFISGKAKRVLHPPLTARAGKGELIAVIGKNGIGKSTLLRTLAGLQPALNGSVSISGKDIREFSRREISERVGFVSTEIIKVSNMTVYDLVSLGRFPHTNWFGKIDTENHKAVTDSIERAGMAGLTNTHITELSDGERQRAMIAMVLAQDAVLMVLDEPTAFLDIRSRFEIMHLLQDLTRKRGKTIIFSTHDFSTAISQADKIWLMQKGSFTEGAPEDIILSGAFNTLFDEKIVSFNIHDGNFSMNNEVKGRISVKGEGDLKYWTGKAVIRSGYSVGDSDFSAEVLTPSGDDPAWKFKTGSFSASFGSIYDLASWLRGNGSLIS